MKKEYSRPNIIVTAYVTISDTNAAGDTLTVRSRIDPINNNDDSNDWTIYDLNQ